MEAGSQVRGGGIPRIGEVVRFHRKTARLTQEELARLAGVGVTVVRQIEKGKRTIRLTTLVRILHALNIRLDWQSPLKEAFDEEVSGA